MFESTPSSITSHLGDFETLWFSHRLIVHHSEPRLSIGELLPKEQKFNQKTAKIGSAFVTQIDFECQGTVSAFLAAEHCAEHYGLKVLSLEHILKAKEN
jgi:hypothetical protein